MEDSFFITALHSTFDIWSAAIVASIGVVIVSLLLHFWRAKERKNPEDTGDPKDL